MKAFIGTYSKDILYLNENEIYPCGKCDSPSYLAYYNNDIVAISELADFDNKETGTVNFFKNNNNILTEKSSNLSFGKYPCHLTTANGICFVANYGSGTVSAYNVENGMELIKTIEHDTVFENKIHDVDSKFYDYLDKEKCAKIEGRQKTAHAHSTVLTSDNKYIAACDLGQDKVVFYDFEMNIHSVFQLPSGQGPRHIIFDENKAYIVTELASTLITCAYNDGILTFESLTYTLKKDDITNNAPAAIRFSPCKKYIAVSNRGHDSISLFDVKNNMKLIQNISSYGKGPRDIEFSNDGKFLLCANQNSNNISFYSVTDGKLEYLYEKTLDCSPVMILFEKNS
ncbi:MAG: beta-propeller fold lactonase family protein [Clostridia bacterium]